MAEQQRGRDECGGETQMKHEVFTHTQKKKRAKKTPPFLILIHTVNVHTAIRLYVEKFWKSQFTWWC